jgi:hypothetical protein
VTCVDDMIGEIDDLSAALGLVDFDDQFCRSGELQGEILE